MDNKKKCFVIMPFSDTQSCTKQEWTGIFKGIIKPAVEESGLGYECERSVAERQNIVKGILEALNKANVVIADLTDNNPNVFYELGVRHTLTNRTVLIAQGEKHIPFDLRPYPVAFYSKSLTNIEEFKSDIRKKLEDIEGNPERSDNPVADFLRKRNIELLSSEKKANLAKLSALISELSYNVDRGDVILKQLKQSRRDRGKGETGPWTTPLRLSNKCLESLITTQYILLPQELLESVRKVDSIIGSINRNLDMWWEVGKEVEERVIKFHPTFKKSFVKLLKKMNKVKLDYTNDNYVEPETPNILLSSPKHKEYLRLTK